MIKSICIVLATLFMFWPNLVLAEPGIPALTVTENADGTQDYTMTLQVLGIMTALSLLPAFIMMMTSFTRIIIVLSILRQAIGLQQSPSNQILIGVSLFLSMFIMAPVFEKINETALQPYLSEQITSIEAYNLAKEPLRAFMLSQTRVKILRLLCKLVAMKGSLKTRLMCR